MSQQTEPEPSELPPTGRVVLGRLGCNADGEIVIVPLSLEERIIEALRVATEARIKRLEDGLVWADANRVAKSGNEVLRDFVAEMTAKHEAEHGELDRLMSARRGALRREE